MQSGPEWRGEGLHLTASWKDWTARAGPSGWGLFHFLCLFCNAEQVMGYLGL